MFHFKTVFVLGLLLISFLGYSQHKITIDDRAGVLETIDISSLNEKLSTYNISYSDEISFSKRCSYKFVTLTLNGQELIGDITNCDNELLANGVIDTKWDDLSSDELILLLSRFIKNNIENEPVSKADNEIKAEVDKDESVEKDENESTLEGVVNHHDTRYLFAPSSYNLRKGELYYNTMYGLIHDVQYGISDHFSVGMGSSIAAFPFYVTPKYSFKISNKSSMSIGDLMILGTYGTNFFGNLIFTTYTYGTSKNNFTIGGAYFLTNQNDLFDSNRPVANFSALSQLSPYIYFLTENYLVSFTSEHSVSRNLDVDPYYESATFKSEGQVLIGFSGFRFVNKKKDISSVQLGLAYLFRSSVSVPSQYSSSDWYLQGSTWNQFALPMISYTLKFGKKY